MQQVNFYLPEFHPKKEVLSFNQMLFAILVIAFVYIAFGYMETTKTNVLKTQLAQEQNNLASLRTQLSEIDATLANRPSENDIDEQIANFQKKLQEKSIAVTTLRNADISASGGFSELIEDLSRHSQPKIWFTNIKVQTDLLDIRGQTVDPKLVAMWVENARSFDTLRRQFSAVKIKENDNNKNVYDFHLSKGVILDND